MFGTPGQQPGQFLDEVARLLELGLSHLSIYALTIEPNTQFGELQRKGKLADRAKRTTTPIRSSPSNSWLAGAGLRALRSVELRASPGETARHNQHYWRGGDYLGIGCAAVGCQHDLARPAQPVRRTRNQSLSPSCTCRSHKSAKRCADFEEPLDAQAMSCARACCSACAPKPAST